MAVFLEKGLNFKFWFWEPKKSTSFRQNWCRHLGSEWSQEPKNSWKSKPMSEVAHAWKQNPSSDLDKILQRDRCPQHNHLCKFKWWL